MNFSPKKLWRALRSFRARDDGGPTVEFVLVFPPFFILLLSAFELGLLMTRHVMLERGLDMAVREIRLNTTTNFTEDQFKAMICNTAGIIPKCMDRLRLEMITVDMRQGNSVQDPEVPREASCRDISEPIKSPRNYDLRLPNQMMIVRACGLFVPMLPETALGYFLSRISSEDRYYRLVSTTAFVQEPI